MHATTATTATAALTSRAVLRRVSVFHAAATATASNAAAASMVNGSLSSNNTSASPAPMIVTYDATAAIPTRRLRGRERFNGHALADRSAPDLEPTRRDRSAGASLSISPNPKEGSRMDNVEAETWPDESGPLEAGLRYEHGKVVPHLTVAERVARGKAARRRGAACEPRGLRVWRDPPRPCRAARASGSNAGAGAGAAPLWPDAGVAVHVLPRRGVDHGERPGQHPSLRAHDAALRRRSPDELRRVRCPPNGGWSSTSTTSTRRCPGRGNGT